MMDFLTVLGAVLGGILGTGVIVWVARKVFLVARDMFIARIKPVMAAKGKADEMKERKKSLMETGGMDDEPAGYWTTLESFPAEMRDLVHQELYCRLENRHQVLSSAKEESISPDDFKERTNDRLLEENSVSLYVLDVSRSTTVDELRSLLGKILAKDVDKRGLIHPSTVECAKRLDADALQSLIQLRVVAWTDVDTPDSLPFLATPISSSVNIDINQHSSLIHHAGLTYPECSRLENLGLIYPQMNLAYNVEVGDGDVEYDEHGELLRCKTTRLRNGQRTLVLGTTETRPFHVGNRHLTIEGAEILGLYMDELYTPRSGYFEKMCEYWKEEGFMILTDPQSPQDPFKE